MKTIIKQANMGKKEEFTQIMRNAEAANTPFVAIRKIGDKWQLNCNQLLILFNNDDESIYVLPSHVILELGVNSSKINLDKHDCSKCSNKECTGIPDLKIGTFEDLSEYIEDTRNTIFDEIFKNSDTVGNS